MDCDRASCDKFNKNLDNNCGLFYGPESCIDDSLTTQKDAVAESPAAMTGLDCLDGVEVVAIEKYRGGFTGLSNDYNKARITISLNFPEHLKLYYKLKGDGNVGKIFETASGI